MSNYTTLMSHASLALYSVWGLLSRLLRRSSFLQGRWSQPQPTSGERRWGKQFSFKLHKPELERFLERRFQAWAKLLQIREQRDRAEMHHCGETWSCGYTTAHLFMCLWMRIQHLIWRWKHAARFRKLVTACTPRHERMITHKVVQRMIWKHHAVAIKDINPSSCVNEDIHVFDYFVFEIVPFPKTYVF